MSIQARQFNPKDNVARALNFSGLSEGEVVVATPTASETHTVSEAVPFKGKFALSPIAAGETVVLHGRAIGTAAEGIDAGKHVHIHNVSPLPSAAILGDVTKVYKLKADPKDGVIRTSDIELLDYNDALEDVDVSSWTGPSDDWKPKTYPQRRTFLGYKRPFRKDGLVGTQNWIFVVPMVGCITGDVEHWVSALNDEVKSRYRNVDGVVALNNRHGCSQTGDGTEFIRKQIEGLCCNPNVGGVVCNGMSCEDNQYAGGIQTPGIKAAIENVFPENRRSNFLANFVDDQFGHLRKQVLSIADVMEAEDRREELGVEHLLLGVECGGSDGLSVLINVIFGRISQWLCGLGGTSVISELDELNPAWILECAESKEVARECLAKILYFNRQLALHGSTKDTNPAEGNIREQISTIDEKQLPATAKAGDSVPILGTLEYGERPTRGGGIWIGATTGNDPRSVTAKVSMGINGNLFSSGNLSWWYPGLIWQLMCASNTPVFDRLRHIADFNGGRLMEEELDLVAEDLWNLMLDAASGQYHPWGAKRGNQRLDMTNVGLFV